MFGEVSVTTLMERRSRKMPQITEAAAGAIMDNNVNSMAIVYLIDYSVHRIVGQKMVRDNKQIGELFRLNSWLAIGPCTPQAGNT